MLGAAAREHALPQLDLPARDREQGGIFNLALAAAPRHLASVELGSDLERHVGRRAEHLLEASGPLPVELDHLIVAGHAQRPTGPTPRQPRDEPGTFGLDPAGAQQPLDVVGGDRVKEHSLAARDDCRQHYERVEAWRREDDHPMRVGLFERFQKHPLVLVPEPPDVGHQRDPTGPDSRLEVQESLERKLMKLWWLVRQEPDLVDRKGLDAVVIPVVWVTAKRCLRQQRRREGAGGCRFAKPRLADEQVSVGEPVGLEL